MPAALGIDLILRAQMLLNSSVLMDGNMTGPEDAEDGDLKLAIALSLESRSTGTGTSQAIIISDSDDDGDSKMSKVTLQKQQTNIGSNNKRKRDDVDYDSSATELSDNDEAQQPGNVRAVSITASKIMSKPASASAVSVPASKKTRQDVGIISGSTSANGSKAHGPASSNTSGSGSALGGIDRAALEKERLARQSAREAAHPSISSSSSSFPTTSAPSNTSVPSQAIANNPTAERKARFATLASLAEQQGDSSSSSSTKGKERESVETGASSSSSGRFGSLETLKKRDRDRKFWNGIVRPTASSRHSGYECFTFADVLGNTDDLESALLTTFCGEPEWIHSQFPSTTKVVLVMPCSKEGNLMEIQIAPNMKLINPKREQAGRGVMHIKLMLLYYKNFLRVAVATANFIQYDWSTIENAVYIHDFPRLPSSSSTSPPPSSSFLDTLLRTHRSLGTPQAYYKTALTNYDYSSAASRVRLVLSVPGTHTGSRALFENGGHISLCKALNDLDLVTPFKNAKLSLECQGSSIGSYTSDWMKSFHRSALGWYPAKNSVFKLEESARKKYAYMNGEWPEDFKIVYPTFKTVKQSLGGPGGGGTIFCPLDTWKKPSFPRQLFYDSRSQRDGLLQHTKMILGIVKPADPPPATPFSIKKDEKETSEPIKPFGWLYVGSHNFTPAAWGRYSEKSGSLSLANHELGVVIPLREEDVEAQASRLVTWKRPLVQYGKDDTPWDQFKYGK